MFHDRHLHQRAEPRRKVFQLAEIFHLGATMRVHLLDLSNTGALVHAAAPPAIGAMVDVTCGFSLGAARVAWVDGKRFGLSFTQRLTDQQVRFVIEARDELVERETRRIGPWRNSLPAAAR